MLSSCGGGKRDARCRVSNVCPLFSMHRCAPGCTWGGKGSSLPRQCALQESSPKERVEIAHKATQALSSFSWCGTHCSAHLGGRPSCLGAVKLRSAGAAGIRSNGVGKMGFVFNESEGSSLVCATPTCCCTDSVCILLAGSAKPIPPFLLLCAHRVLCFKSTSGGVSLLLRHGGAESAHRR